LIYLSYVADYGTYDNITGVWSIGNISAGSSVVLSIFLLLNGTGNISNSANFTVNENNTGDFNASGNGTNNITVLPSVNISIIKSVNVTGTVLNGDIIAYTIVVTNHGPNSTTNLIVTDVLDPRLIYISSNATQGNYNYSTSNWTIGNLNNGDTVVLDIIVQLNGTGNIDNVANLTVDENNNGNNNTGVNVTNITVEPVVNISIVKSVNVSGKIFNGALIKYTITITNHGMDDATSVNVIDNLDSRLTYINSIVSQGSYDDKTGNWNIGNLSIGANAKLEIFAKVNGIGNISNTVNLTVDQKNIGDNSSSTSINVVSSPKSPTKIVLTNSKVSYGKYVQLKATLSSGTKKLSNKIVKFYVNGKYKGQTKTNSQGIAILKYKVNSFGKLTISTTFSGDDNYSSSKANKVIVSPKTAPKIIYRDNIIKKGRYYLATYVLINVGSAPWSHYFKEFTKQYHKVFKVKVTKFKVSYNYKLSLLRWYVKGLKPYNIAKMYILYDYKL
jgi:uncharacterized repeat protein (TIGR01451 family)